MELQVTDSNALRRRIDGLGVRFSGRPDFDAIEQVASVVPLVAMMIDFRSDRFDAVTVDESDATRRPTQCSA